MTSREIGEAVAATIAGYVAVGIPPAAAGFAREVVAEVAPVGPPRARALLWPAGRLGAWALSVGLELRPEVVLHPSVIERYVAVGMAGRSPAARRTARTNLRFIARRAAPGLAHPPAPEALRRTRAKASYSPAEVDAFFALAGAQPTEYRRWRLVGLLCLGLGAGLERGELRAVTGRHVVARSGGVVVMVQGPRARVVPVLGEYHQRLLDAAACAGEGFMCGGRSPTRRNVTSNLIDQLSGGTDLGRLDVGRLRATWLATHMDRLGVAAFLGAAGIVCSQRLGDMAAHLPAVEEATAVALLGGGA